MIVKVHELTPGSHFSFYKKGEWIDLKAAETITLHAPQAGTQYERDGKKFRDVNFESALIPLGFSMAIPKGFEAIIVPRSSTFKNFNIIQGNHIGVIDSKLNYRLFRKNCKTAVFKQGELLGNLEKDNQQPSQELTSLEGSETNT